MLLVFSVVGRRSQTIDVGLNLHKCVDTSTMESNINLNTHVELPKYQHCVGWDYFIGPQI